MRFLIPLIIIVPAMEIGLLMLSGRVIGVLPTVFMIISTGVLGAWLAKREGLETLRRAQNQMSYGGVPGREIMDGICILIGGLLLLTPGFLTDITGFFLLLPRTRPLFKQVLKRIFQRIIDRGQFTFIRR